MLSFGLGLSRHRAGFAISYNDETQAMIDKAVAQGFALPSAANLSLISSLIDGAKASGDWAKADRVAFWGNDSGSINFGRINAKSPSDSLATIVNAMRSVNKKGIEGDGVSAYVDTGYNPTTDAVNYGINSASILIYQYKVPTIGVSLVGSDSSNVRIQSRNTSIQRLNSEANLSTLVDFGQEGTIGMHKKTDTDIDVQVNSTISATTYLSSSPSLPSASLTLLAAADATIYSNAGIALEWVGGDSSANALALNTLFTNYYTQLQLL